MLQRVGRTGRKRDGRVVFLISEGAEEKTYRESKNKERTIIRAMKRPDAFVVHPSVRMLPMMPVLCEQDMTKTSAQPFHMTQVEGQTEVKRRRQQKPSKQSGHSAEDKTWKLSRDEETRRAAVLGGSNTVKTACDHAMQSLIRKRILSARNFNAESFIEKTCSRVGRVASLLRGFERNYASSGHEAKHLRRKTMSRVSSGGQAIQTPEICAWFPIADREDAFETMAWGKPHQRWTARTENDQSSPDIGISMKKRGSIQSLAFKDHNTATVETATGSANLLAQNGAEHNVPDNRLSLLEDTTAEASKEALPQTRQKLESKKGISISCSWEKGRSGQFVANGDTIKREIARPCALATESPDPNHERPYNAATESSTRVVTKEKQAEVTKGDIFQLPTPNSSSDDDSDHSCDGEQLPPNGGQNEENQPLPKFELSLGNCSSPNAGNDLKDAWKQDEAFRLPTQSSSSSDEDDSNEAPSHKANSQLPETNGNSTAIATSEFQNTDRDGEESDFSVGKRRPSRNKRKRVVDDSSDDASFKNKGQKDCAQEEWSRGVGNMIATAIQDSPESLESLEDSPESTEARASILEDSHEPEDRTRFDDIVCAICQSGESPDEDPIYLCDGPGNGVECNLAVHATCYSVVVSNSQDEWRCDPCAYRFNSGSDDVRCFVCGSDKGPLRKSPTDRWVHCFCNGDNAPETSHLRSSHRRIVKKNQKPKKRHYSYFLEEEASISSDEDIDGDEDEDEDVADIEEEENVHSSFINDSSQLGYAPDALDDLGPENEEDGVHRAVDHEWEVQNEFKTPALNRRMAKHRRKKHVSSSSHGFSDASTVPGSEEGVGNMHFIRSVIDHHRQGGTAQQIEHLYEQMEAANDEDASSVECTIPEPKRTVVNYKEESDDEDHWNTTS